jgi:hypothetical protein
VDAVAEVEFHQDTGDVGLDGRLTDDELPGDLRVREAASEELERLGLSRGELVMARPSLSKKPLAPAARPL